MKARLATPKGASPKSGSGADEALSLARRHLRLGWWLVLIFLTLGILLESLHGFKAGCYLNVSNSTRRFMFTLAHAHGTLLGLLHVYFAAALVHLTSWDSRNRRLAANCLFGATILIPAGFFAGGLVFYAGDPGLGIISVPVGALLFVVAVLLTARAFAQRR